MNPSSISAVSKSMESTALAPSFLAWFFRSSMASFRAFSISSAYAVPFPSVMDWMPETNLPPSPLVLVLEPYTTPRTSSISYFGMRGIVARMRSSPIISPPIRLLFLLFIRFCWCVVFLLFLIQ